MPWPRSYDPLGNPALSTALAAVPIVVLLGTLASGKVKAHWAALLGLLSALALAPSLAHAQPAAASRDSVVVDTVAPGVVHTAIVRPAGPWRIHVLAVDLRGERYQVATMRARDSLGNTLRGRERTTELARRAERESGSRAVAAINADFFDLRSGEVEHNLVAGGRLLKGVRGTDAPGDAFDTPHGQFAVGTDGRPHVERFSFEGIVERRWGALCGIGLFCRRREARLDMVNAVPDSGAVLALFTAEHRGAPRIDTTDTAAVRWWRSAVELPLRREHGGGRTEWHYEIADTLRAVGSGPIPDGGAVLVAYGEGRRRLSPLVGEGRLTVRWSMHPDRGRLATLTGGRGRIVVDGRSIAARVDSIEETAPSFSARRHPRSAIGISRDSATLYLVAVDGRQEASVGMTLAELADLLVSLGVHQGLNLDGGGSTALVVQGQIVNRPSDARGERAVANAIVILSRAHRRN